MALVWTDRGDIRVVALSGELDNDGSRNLSADLRAVAENGPAKIVLDLSGVTFLGSHALSALLDFHRLQGAEEREVRLAGAKGSVSRVLAITGVADRIGIDEAAP